MAGGESHAVTVLRPGPLALIVDLGRPGHAHLGVPPSGALDQPALRLANRLVGNPESAAGLELLLGGAQLRAEGSCVFAVTGPPVGLTTPAGSVGSHRPVHVADGDTLTVSSPTTGLRCYLAVSGGLTVAPTLGSRSADQLSGLGPPALQVGQRLAVGEPRAVPDSGVVPASLVPQQRSVAVRLGPRDEFFADAAGDLGASQWVVSVASNRVGLRLTGAALTRSGAYQHTELPSEPVLTGAIQVPPDGQPVIFLADHPTTGGYPVIGVVAPDDLPALAQARPGTTLRFGPIRSAGA